MTNTKIKKDPGVYPGLSFEEYISIDAFHKSMVAPVLRSTEHLHHHIETEKESSKFMDFGSLVDCMLLEPDIFGDTFIEKPETYINSKDKEMPFNMNSNWCKDWMADIRARELTPYTKADYSRALIIQEKVLAHETAGPWLDDAKLQVAIVWKDEETGLLCKSRIDAAKPDRLIDLKTTGDASPGEFARTMNNLGYHVQAAMYTDGWATLHDGHVLPWSFIVAESKAPHSIATYNIGDESILAGKWIFQKALHRYKDYLAGMITGYSQLPEELDIPVWAINQAEADFDESKLKDAS